jgi:hypothetical protein
MDISEKEPRVFITQIPWRMNQKTRLYEPIFPLNVVSEHGRPVEMFLRTDTSLSHDISRRVRNALADFDVAMDFILTSGDPGIISHTCAILGREHGGAFTQLLWDKRTCRYFKLKVRV